MTIERKGIVSGRWPTYTLIVNGVEIGEVKRTLTKGGGDKFARRTYDGWQIHGAVLHTREEAEKALIVRAIRFGKMR